MMGQLLKVMGFLFIIIIAWLVGLLMGYNLCPFEGL